MVRKTKTADRYVTPDAVPIGESVDRLYEISAAIAAANKTVAALKSERAAIHEKLLNEFDRSALTGAFGKTAKLRVDIITEPVIEDFTALFRWASRTKNYGVFQRRLSPETIRALWDDGRRPGGVGRFDRTRFSVTKR